MRSSLSIILFVILSVAFGLKSGTATAAMRSKSVALVIGNTNYMQLPRLRNAANDALSVARALSDKGFTVFLAQDVTTQKLRQTLIFVANQAKNADRILIYYAGHSEIKYGTPQLLSTDYETGLEGMSSQSISIAEVMVFFDIPFAQKAIILDACLENADLQEYTGSQTLYLPKALGIETLLVFATSFGHAAYDGSGVHSIFTGALLDHMARDKFDLQMAIRTVRKEVIQTSRSNQIPISISTLTEPYIFSSKGYISNSSNFQNDLIQSYSSSGYANKPLLDTLSVGINLSGF